MSDPPPLAVGSPGPPGLPPAPATGATLGDLATVALAAGAWAGASVARPVPLVAAGVATAVALVARRPLLLVVAVAALASGLGARSLDGLDPVRSGPFEDVVTLVGDPVLTYGTVSVDVRSGRRHLELRAAGAGQGSLVGRLAGERVRVVGRLRPPPPEAPWLVVRHVVGRIDAATVDPVDGGAAPWRAANRVRRLLLAGAASLPPERRSLFAGFVLGDDREQSATTADDFVGSGLTHLLAVSGENVAFVLALAGPALRRLGRWWRWLATLALLAGFVLITRAEPSVLRAGVMAGAAASAAALGRPAHGARVLSLAVTLLVLVDPLLTRSVGFRLSVAACAGIVVVGPHLRARLPGPRALVDAFAVTASAQLAVAPLIAVQFGGVPVVSVPANLLAGPAAGVVMMWGLGAGLVAGAASAAGAPGIAALLHTPTSLLVGWIAAVARTSSSLPLGELGTRAVLEIALAAGFGLLASHLGWPRVRRVAVAVVVATSLAPALAARRAPPGPTPLGPSATLWRSGGAAVVVIERAGAVDDLLAAARRAGVRGFGLVVVEPATASAVAQVEALGHRWPIGAVWAPVAARRPGAAAPSAGTRAAVGPFVVEVVRAAPLEVEVVERGPP